MKRQSSGKFAGSAKSLLLISVAVILILGACTKNIPILHEKRDAIAVLPFNDIPAPLDMSVDNAQTRTIETDHLQAGTVTLSGYVKEQSLVNFYREEMPKYGWRLQNVYTGDRTTMLFYKKGRSAIINIQENLIKTVVEIKSAPDR